MVPLLRSLWHTTANYFLTFMTRQRVWEKKRTGSRSRPVRRQRLQQFCRARGFRQSIQPTDGAGAHMAGVCACVSCSKRGKGKGLERRGTPAANTAAARRRLKDKSRHWQKEFRKPLTGSRGPQCWRATAGGPFPKPPNPAAGRDGRRATGDGKLGLAWHPPSGRPTRLRVLKHAHIRARALTPAAPGPMEDEDEDVVSCLDALHWLRRARLTAHGSEDKVANLSPCLPVRGHDQHGRFNRHGLWIRESGKFAGHWTAASPSEGEEPLTG